MTEETKTEEKQEPKPVGKKEERADFLTEARELRDSIDKAKDEIKGMVARNEEIAAKNILAGKSDAGEQEVEEKKELTPAEYKDKVMSGEIPPLPEKE